MRLPLFTCYLGKPQKSNFIMTVPLRPYPPPFLVLNGSRNFFNELKKKSQKSDYSLWQAPLRNIFFLRLPLPLWHHCSWFKMTHYLVFYFHCYSYVPLLFKNKKTKKTSYNWHLTNRIVYNIFLNFFYDEYFSLFPGLQSVKKCLEIGRY